MKKSDNPKLILELMFIELLNYNEQKIEEPKKININTNEFKEEVKRETLVNDVLVNNKIKKENNINELKNINKEIINEIEELKQIRIDNTLSAFNKKEYLILNKELENVRSMILDPDHSKAASIVIDGILKAASETNLIYVFNTQSAADAFNSNLKIIETMIENILNRKYNCIATNINDWEKIKKEFNNHEKEYEIKEDKEIFYKIFNKETKENEKDEIEEMFENIVEYN